MAQDPSVCTTWQIVDGSGSYRELQGRGSLRAELLSDEGFAIWRSTLEGVIDTDAVARAELARKFGTAEEPAVSLALRVLPQSANVNTVRHELTASDPAGNAASMRRFVKLPR